MPAVMSDRFLASMLRREYHAFFYEFWPIIAAEDLVDEWYIKRLCKELQFGLGRVFASLPKLYDLVWNCPPGTSKSSIVSILSTPWCWTCMPSLRHISGSYSERLALDHSRKSRDVIKSEKYRRLFPDIELREDQDTKSYFANTKGGMRFATGVGGSVLGMHAHFISIDDPIDPTKSLSDIEIAGANAWCSETLSRRKIHLLITFMCLIMQRLHQDDPTGHFIAKKLPIKHFIIPCDVSWDIKPPELKSEYSSDGLLSPTRLPRTSLDNALEELLEPGYACQYGQTPIPRGSAKFDISRINYHNTLPKVWKKHPIRYWDKATTEKGGAFTVGVKMGIDMDDMVWVIDVQRFQKNSGNREKEMLRIAQRDGKAVIVYQEQEPSAAGVETCQASMRRLAMKGFRARADLARGDKELRSDPFSIMVNTGHVILMLGQWNQAFVEEHRYFPRSKYKDQVDAASGAFAMLTGVRKYKIGAFSFAGENSYD